MSAINDWNAKIDRTMTVYRLGKQGIMYEYLLPYGADPMHYYEEAIDVRSRKSLSKYDNGRRAGQYQPVGDKKYFNYYQLKKMTAQQRYDWSLEQYAKIVAKAVMEDFYW